MSIKLRQEAPSASCSDICSYKIQFFQVDAPHICWQKYFFDSVVPGARVLVSESEFIWLSIEML
jgi:hypothetical protein